jgi:glutamate racemase
MYKKIALVDSGYGGLLLSSHIYKNFPGVEIIYMGDTKNMPYGEKGVEFLNSRYQAFQKQAKEMGVDLLVVACNTLSATSHQTEEKLVDTIDIISISIDHLNKKNIEKVKLIATPNTIKSQIYPSNLNGTILVQEIAAKNLASIIENGSLKEVENEFENLLGEIEGNIMLGCTHYSVLTNSFANSYPNLNMISQDSILEEFLKSKYLLDAKQPKTIKLFVNAELEKYTGFAQKLFKNGEFEIKLLDF